MYDVNDQLKIVKMWWDELMMKDSQRNKVEGMAAIQSQDLPVDDIARMFKDMKIF